MLKTQLRSKLFPLHSRWGEVEDILTGDYFGTLDYLPRRPFLAEFITHIAGLNHGIQPPRVEDVDWDGIEFRFWPMISTADETAEPDVLLISNRWVLVVEVKLGIGLGFEQPWREYRVGQEIARRNGLSKDSVFYLLVTRTRASVAPTFTSDQALERDELVSKTMYLRWFQAVSMIETWLRRGAGGNPLAPEHERMLRDLREAMRKRRSIVFSGFSFDHQERVIGLEGAIFCPPAFQGFLADCSDRVAETSTSVFLSRFRGFLVDARQATDSAEGLLSIEKFNGFVTQAPSVRDLTDGFLRVSQFPGFLMDSKKVTDSAEGLLSFTKFNGFVIQAPWIDGASDGFLPVSQFPGFLNEDTHPIARMDRIFAPSVFCGFLHTAPRCRQDRTMLF